MKKLVKGVKKFQEKVFPKRKELFDELATGQSPETLFITCSDSRIDPVMITQTLPGELFICRNAGNIIPPHSNNTGGMTASIEYSVKVLGVKNIIVCGHSDCGAVRAAVNPESLEELPHVSNWLGHAQSAVYSAEARCSCHDIQPEDIEKVRLVTEENIIQQMMHLKTHPTVAAKLATNDINIYGWLYDIGTGDVFLCNEETREFYPVSEHKFYK